MAVIVSIAGIALFAYMDGIKGSTTLGGASLAGILTHQILPWHGTNPLCLEITKWVSNVWHIWHSYYLFAFNMPE